jgi:ABC-type sugar transport system ATPase subunit
VTTIAQTEKTARPLKPPPEEENLSAAAKAEAEANYRVLLEKCGARLNTEQKTDVHRLLMQQQKSIEAVRAFKLENRDEPSLVLHLDEPEVR